MIAALVLSRTLFRTSLSRNLQGRFDRGLTASEDNLDTLTGQSFRMTARRRNGRRRWPLFRIKNNTEYKYRLDYNTVHFRYLADVRLL